MTRLQSAAGAPRLSICIPTLNRAELLGETLQSILTQITPEVEVVIVDGASTDATPDVVSSLQQKYDCIRYERLPQRGGFDRDLALAVELARGEYCWTFSDDDLMKPGAVQRVLDALTADPAVVVVNGELRNKDLSFTFVPNRCGVTSDKVYSPDQFPAFFVDAGYYLSFVGAMVIRRNIWIEREKERYIGTYFVHVGVIFQKTLPGPALIIAEPLILIRHGDSSWSARTFEIWMFKWPELVWSFPLFSDAEKRRVFEQFPWRNLITLIQYRAIGAYGPESFDHLLAQRMRGPHRLAARLIAATPGKLLNFLSVVYCHLTGSKMALDTLRRSRYYLAG